MSQNIDTLVGSILEGISPLLTAALRPHVQGVVTAQTSLGVPEVVRLAMRISSLREELAAVEAQLQRALRQPVAELVLEDPIPKPALKSLAKGLPTKAPATKAPSAPSEKAPSTKGPVGKAPSAKASAAPAPSAKGTSASLYDRVAAAVADRRTPFATAEVVTATGGNPATVRTFLDRLVARGSLRKASRGAYVTAGAPKRMAQSAARSPRRTKKSQRTQGAGSLSARALALLAERGAPVTSNEIAKVLDAELPSIAAAMSKLTIAGKIRRVSPGVFARA